ncbi:hypothetical protein EXS62_02095 [Candidatus Kaiserbacteria bacterium]|nr:hypothetical protein [Candidatus Kaiserbacteria bacterium]
MSKETAVIVLGALIIAIRVVLGVPGSWQTALFVLTGVAVIALGFLLRGEAIGRSAQPRGAHQKHSYPFVDSTAPAAPSHESEGITSLN